MTKKFPKFDTKRLLLRKLNENDAEALFAIRSDDRVNAYIHREPPKNIDVIRTFIYDRNLDFEKNKLIYWCISKKEHDQLIGTCCLWNFNHDKHIAEVGYELHPDHHGQGFMTEALQTILKYGFNTLGFKMMEAIIHRENRASQQLAGKFNFVLNPDRKDNNVIENQFFECYA